MESSRERMENNFVNKLTLLWGNLVCCDPGGPAPTAHSEGEEREQQE